MLLDERFPGDRLDPDVWLPHYLPQWSSRAASRATHTVRDGELRLSIPAGQGLWCPDRHPEPLRVSAVQSACFSGPVGGTVGGQPFADGLTVTEQQPPFAGCTPTYGHVEVRARAVIGARSMVSFWLSGIEDVPERSGEICVMEVFGDTVDGGGAGVGVGLHRFRDPVLPEDFAVVRLPIDVTRFHTYAVDWRPGSVAFTVDGEPVRRVAAAPDYPVQLMLGVFDFPARAAAEPDPEPEPEFVVSRVLVRPPD